MKNRGKNTHRFKDNPLEERYAKAWESINTDRNSTIEYILARDINKPQQGEVSKRDREVAASVIQWLGSPVGNSFVREVLERSS